MIDEPAVFDAGFVPNDINHRDAEMTALSTALDPITHDKPALDTVITGETGVGKTVVTKHSIRELRRENVAFTDVYLSCWTISQRDILASVLEASVPGTTPVESYSANRIIRGLKDAVDEPTVVVLDEADQLDDDARRALYPLAEVDNISIIFICNDDTEFFATLERRVRSRLSGTESIHFDPYSDATLQAILEERARAGLSPRAWKHEHLRTIAKRASDARRAIDYLEKAARVADRNGKSQITKDAINEAVPIADRERIEEIIEQLGPHPTIVWEILRDAGKALRMSGIFEQYEPRVDEPKTKQTVRRYLRKIEEYGLIVSEGTTKGKQYRSRDFEDFSI